MNYFKSLLLLGSLFFSLQSLAQIHFAFDYRPGTLNGDTAGPWTKFENPAVNQIWINGQRGFVVGETERKNVETYLAQQVELKNINIEIKKEIQNLLTYFSASQEQRGLIKDFVPANLRPAPLPAGVEQNNIDSALKPLWNAVESEDLRGAATALEQTRGNLNSLSPQERKYGETELNRLFTYPTGQLKNLPYLNTSPITFNSPSNSPKLAPFTSALNGQLSVEAALRKEILDHDNLGAGERLRLQRENLVSRRLAEALKIEEFRTHYFNHKSEFPNDVINELRSDDQDSARSEIYERSQEIIKNNPKLYKEISPGTQTIDDRWLDNSSQLSLCIQSGSRCDLNEPTGDPSLPVKKVYDDLTSLHDMKVASAGVKDSDVKSLSSRLVDYAHDKVLGDAADSSYYVDLAKQVTDMGLGIIPYVGTAKDFVELVTGISLISGEPLDLATRSIMAASVVIDFASFGVGGRITKLSLETGLHSLGSFFKSDPTAAVFNSAGKHWEDVSGFCDEVVSRVAALEFKDPIVAKSYARIHEAIKTLPGNLSIRDVKEGGAPDKIAIIGRKMMGGVNDVSDHFKSFGNEVKTFMWTDDAKIEFKYLADKFGGRIPYEEVQKTLAFKENQEWIENLVKEGYNIFDIHDPLGANITEGFSAFYDMETLTVWGKLIR